MHKSLFNPFAFHAAVRRHNAILRVEGLETRLVPTTVTFSASTFSVDENAGTAVVYVNLDSSSTQTITVDYGIDMGGTATSGHDFSGGTGSLNFAPGETQKSFNVSIVNDTIDEDNETVNLKLTNPTNASLGTPTDEEDSGFDIVLEGIEVPRPPQFVNLADANETGIFLAKDATVPVNNIEWIKANTADLKKSLKIQDEPNNFDEKMRLAIFNAMANQPLQFKVLTEAGLQSNIDFRVNTIKTMLRMNYGLDLVKRDFKDAINSPAIDFGFGNNNTLSFHKDYWKTTVGDKSATLSPVTASAYDSMIDGIEKTTTRAECQLALQSAILIGAAKTMGKAQFDTLHPIADFRLAMGSSGGGIDSASKHQVLSNLPPVVNDVARLTLKIRALEAKPTPTPDEKAELTKLKGELATKEPDRVKAIRDPKLLVPGDFLYFQNSSFYIRLHKGLWQGENALYIGKDAKGNDLFCGLGFIGTEAELNAKLKAALLDGLTDEKIKAAGLTQEKIEASFTEIGIDRLVRINLNRPPKK